MKTVCVTLEKEYKDPSNKKEVVTALEKECKDPSNKKEVLTASKKKDPVLSALEGMGFIYSVKNKTNWIMVHRSHGKRVLNFFATLSKKLKLHGSKDRIAFHSPVFSGDCISSSAKLDGFLYRIDIMAGAIHVTKVALNK